MAIAITEPIAELLSTTDAQATYALSAFTPTANSILTVDVHVRGSLSAGTVSGGGLTWTLLLKTDNSGANGFLATYYAVVGGSPVSTTITYTAADSSTTACLMCAHQVTGHNVLNIFAQTKAAVQAADINPRVTLDRNMNTLNGYISTWVVGRATPSSTPPTGWTETVDGGVSTPTSGMASAHRAGGETGNTVTFTASSGTWVIHFYEINEASIGGTGRKPMLTLVGAGCDRKRNMFSNLRIAV